MTDLQRISSALPSPPDSSGYFGTYFKALPGDSALIANVILGRSRLWDRMV